ncbi:MAG: hypothetical protein DRP85_05790 [Candidatus Makaraimicrobium thalassicum]|nr:MAG: hypothetical protein DRP85_05790 [Candidatus Omnitrophota bacterium]
MILDENPKITDGEKLPLDKSLKVLRYRTIKKNAGLGWWSAVVLLEDHEKKQVCFYRWRKKKGDWKRDKKLPFKSSKDWLVIKEAVESFLGGLDEQE